VFTIYRALARIWMPEIVIDHSESLSNLNPGKSADRHRAASMSGFESGKWSSRIFHLKLLGE
jgi:hypothetical protein